MKLIYLFLCGILVIFSLMRQYQLQQEVKFLTEKYNTYKYHFEECAKIYKRGCEE